MFIKYQHVERFGTNEVEGVSDDECYVFPKIDGTNGSIWFEDGEIQFGSRRKHLNLEEKDNAGFMRDNKEMECFIEFFKEYPGLRLYGEWLVPHSLKTYKEDAWRKFYVFDVCWVKEELQHPSDSLLGYMHYEDYQPKMEEFGIEYIPPISIVKNGSYDKFVEQTKKNNFLIEDGNGIGEGIVIKNYNFVNKYGRQTWAKIVTSEFKEKHTKEMGTPVITGELQVEDRIMDDFCTEAFIEKTYAKMVVENNGWSTKMIPQLLGRVFNELATEEIWNIIKKYKFPRIDFRRLNKMVILKVKKVKEELF